MRHVVPSTLLSRVIEYSARVCIYDLGLANSGICQPYTALMRKVGPPSRGRALLGDVGTQLGRTEEAPRERKPRD